VEAGTDPDPLSAEERLRLLRRLMEVNGFETFLHRTFAGQKRFSIEGLDSLVPMLDELVRLCAGDAYTHIMIGMAHRGRLNVLAHVLGKPYETIFSEFHHTVNKHLVPSEGSTGINHGWTGDVKYHLGATRDVPPDGNATRSIRLTLANNPSHLEFVNPVVLGFTRSVQDDRSRPGYPEQNTGRALAVLIHGDAAFSGEGIVQETLNLSRLPGYQVGGTIHIVANNGLGFTAESRDSRSTKYASDLAKGFEIPIVHVNADDPEACLRAMRLAYAYRQKYRKDFLIDLIGYRRFGHNESDDPMVTQPQLYRKIERHPRVTELYADGCLAAGIVSRDQLGEWERETEEKLRSAYNRMKQQGKRVAPASPAVLPEPDEVRTGVPLEELRDLNRLLLQFPPDFRVYPKLERILRRRAEMLADGGTIDWALAETLAFASILKEGRAVRLTGQDTERGTFAHRHLVLHDTESGATYSPLHRLASARASFAVHNSPLSEASVLGYEYGYSVCAPEVLVIWEAQFGDFVNVAQVIIDQFISSGWAKWKERSGLVLLLPHGYEGQGPEHSSARLERFLQLAAEHNWTVCNVTSAAQYFHLLRRQAAMLGTDRARPLILMSPKSLLRHPRAASPARALSDGRFARILELPQAGAGGDAGKVTRLILCSGKAAVDLESRWDETAEEDRGFLRIVRLEQLYPFPEREIADVLQRYPQLREIVWVQEEPRNMGAWTYVAPHIRKLAGTRGVRCIARPEHASPAEGYPEMHQAEQNRILTEAFWPSKEVVYHGNSHSGAR
jgi:2-oxoglutarate dehydrogenase E1 component